MSAASRPLRVPAAAAAIALALAAAVLTAPAAAAAAPAATLVGPADGATTGAVPTLSVVADDPDGGSLDVVLEGRPVGATVPGPTSAAPFSIVVVPDTQNYSYANEANLEAQLRWVRDSRAALGTAFVIQLGDLVSDWDVPRQWTNVSTAFRILDDAAVPYTVLPGNHDFDEATGDLAEYEARFGVARFAGAAWNDASTRYGGHLGQSQFGPDPVDRGNGDSYALFTAGGRDFLVLNLEWEAPRVALDWAERVIDAHPGRIVILATHSFLRVDGLRNVAAERRGGTSQTALWQDFVRTNCEIRLVVAGHAHDGDLGEANRTDANACGQPVHQILSNYQARANGGDGWLRTYRFDPAAGTMRAETYSPVLGRSETDASSAFTLPFPLAEPQPAPFAPIASRTVAAGGTAAAPWEGLAADTAYEWRAVVDDGTTRTTSPTWTLRTPPPAQQVLAADAFERTTSAGWGTADVGGAWTTSGGSGAPLSVTGGRGQMALIPSQTRVATLGAVSADAVVVDATLRSDVASVGGAAHATIQGRTVGASSYGLNVRFEPQGVLRLHLLQGSTGLATATGTWSPGQPLAARLSVTGTSPTQLAASVWPAGGTPPASWQLTATSSTAGLQTAGTVAIKGSVSASSTVSTTRLTFDDLRVTGPGAPPPPPPPPPNQPPVASFTTSLAGAVLDVDGSGSSDADGQVMAWSWRFGDGGTATGATARRTYAAPGTYVVGLTVTDDDGATATTERTVVVAPPPPPPPDVLASDAFERSATGGWGAADVGGAWTASGGTTAPFSVAGGRGLLALAPAQTRTATLGSLSTSDAVVQVAVRADVASAGGAASATVLGRSIGTANYAARLRLDAGGAMRLFLLRGETALGAAGGVVLPGTYAPGEAIVVRLSVRGTSPTALAASAWRATRSPPAQWQIQATDTTAGLQAAGQVALRGAISSSSTAPRTVLSFDDLRVTRAA